MKRIGIFLAAALAVASAPATATDVGVSVSIGQPGFYGRIDIGSFPPPAVVYAEPVIIQPAPVAVVRRPIYLHVPPGHSKNWAKHCHRYGACGQPVYFVQQRWYDDVYVPRYRGSVRHEVRHEHMRHERVRDDHRHFDRRHDDRHDFRRHDARGRDGQRGDRGGQRGERGDRGDGKGRG